MTTSTAQQPLGLFGTDELRSLTYEGTSEVHQLIIGQASPATPRSADRTPPPRSPGGTGVAPYHRLRGSGRFLPDERVVGAMRRRTESRDAAFLRAGYAELRAAIDRVDADQLIRIIDHIRAEAGEAITLDVVGNLLRLARNPITDPDGAACIEIAMQRYQSRFG